MPGIPVKIMSSGGLPVKSVTSKAPVMTVGASGVGITLSDRGVPFVVEGASVSLPRTESLGGSMTAATGLFQNVAGTTPVTADGQPVGYMADQSAAGFHLTATADDTTRPTYRVAGNVKWLEFDGTNDMLRRLAALNLWSANGYTAIAAIRGGPPAADRCLIAQGAAASNQTIMGVMQTQATNGANSAHLYRSDAGVVVNSSAGLSGPGNEFAASDTVLTVVDNGSSVVDYRDGVAGTPIAYTRGANALTMARFSLGALLRQAVPASWWAGRVYGFAIWPGVVLTAPERAQALTYMAALQGRTL